MKENLPYFLCDTDRLPIGGLRFKCRGYQPHLDLPGAYQMITFRLYDSPPVVMLGKLEDRILHLPNDEERRRLIDRFEKLLEKHRTNKWLTDPRVASLVVSCFKYFDGERYNLTAWVIMPNHVHVLLNTLNSWPVPKIVHSWKLFSGREANKLIGKSGHFWQREYYDRVIRSEFHLQTAIRYIHFNPVKARLCARPEDWPYSSAYSGGNSTDEVR